MAVGVIGAGTMGIGIAHSFITNGIHTTLTSIFLEAGVVA
jgi:3-hydroxyacyl-CoA dehydrogenase